MASQKLRFKLYLQRGLPCACARSARKGSDGHRFCWVWGIPCNPCWAIMAYLGDRVRHNSPHVRCKKNIFFFFQTSDLSKEQMQSNKFLNEYSSAYTILQQRAPQNHRTGFVICRTVQAQTENTENDGGYAGGKKQTNTISQGPCVATLCSSHSFWDHTISPFLLANFEEHIYA